MKKRSVKVGYKQEDPTKKQRTISAKVGGGSETPMDVYGKRGGKHYVSRYDPKRPTDLKWSESDSAKAAGASEYQRKVGQGLIDSKIIYEPGHQGASKKSVPKAKTTK